MEIINKQRIITNSQLEEVMNLLGQDYMPFRIIVFENTTESIVYRIKNIFDIADYELRGMWYLRNSETIKFMVLKDTIKIYLNYKKNINEATEEKQVSLIYDLVAELKRRYYYVEKLKEKDPETIAIPYLINIYCTLSNDPYVGEVYKFASYFMNENADRLSEIMNWKEKWTY